MSFATAPRIYCINPALVSLRGWPALLDHCVTLGFDHVLLTNALNLGQHPDAEAGLPLDELTAACSDRGLHLLLDIVLDRVSSDDPLIDAYPSWFENKPSPDNASSAGGQLVTSDSVIHLRMADCAVQRGLYALWCRRLRGLLDVGVAGFVCSAPAAVPVTLWRALMTATRSYRNSVSFLAWTPGSSAPQLDPLTDAGFDAVFCSGAWWDYQATRYVREQDNLIGDATIIAFPETPFGPRLAGQLSLTDAPSRRRASLRALRFAAASGNGILIPMGFELGLTVPLDTVLTPVQYASLCEEAEIDLRDEIQQANRFIVDIGRYFLGAPVALLRSPGSGLALLQRSTRTGLGGQRDDNARLSLLIVVNQDLYQTWQGDVDDIFNHVDGYVAQADLSDWNEGREAAFSLPQGPLLLEAAEIKLWLARAAPSGIGCVDGGDSRQAA
ncbi:starch synthase (maltosyl-transferring) [Collimonas sp. OK607]|uniref:hypothetical protein n=1 Tax=Collimonas sp. OK607 TaxID=1798194 RepID=UPI0008F00727|nr:hypothetical protein [Collimonas sp. OK607]SFB23494.1 starch synthase (maltosyl-transferring) [Collimonas sp. OK607]